jgi:hypothetical protein
MIERLPQPAGRFLVLDVRPHFISLSFLDTGEDDRPLRISERL